MKPSFLKPEKIGNGLCKLLIEKTGNDVRGENGALMKKGLRPPCGSCPAFMMGENGALMKKGLRLL